MAEEADWVQACRLTKKEPSAPEVAVKSKGKKLPPLRTSVWKGCLLDEFGRWRHRIQPWSRPTDESTPDRCGTRPSTSRGTGWSCKKPACRRNNLALAEVCASQRLLGLASAVATKRDFWHRCFHQAEHEGPAASNKVCKFGGHIAQDVPNNVLRGMREILWH